MLNDFLTYTQDLKKKNEPFAMAIIVRREAPSSGKVGDKAVINRHGELLGWVGGGCVKGILLKEARDAMRSGKARLVRIGKGLENIKQEGLMQYKMTCQSEGAVEVFVEPVMPMPHLVVIGKSAIAKSLVKLAKVSGYRVTGVAPEANLQTFDKVDELITQVKLDNVKTTEASCIVIATQGENDEQALLEALRKPFGYLGFVASRKKMQSVREYLVAAGADAALVDRIKAPAGLDINAKKHEEVALSILAEIVLLRNHGEAGSSFTDFEQAEQTTGAVQSPVYYINPVCGVPVDINNPKHIVEYEGEKVYFCCDGCKVKFERAPAKYIQARALGLEPEGM